MPDLKVVIDATPALIWSTLANGEADSLNQHYLDYVGQPLADLKGWGWAQSVHPDDRESLATIWQQLLASGAAGEAEARLRRHDGEYRWFLFRVSPLRDANGSILKWYGVNTDIEDRKRAEEGLRRAHAHLSEAQRLSKTGSFTTDLVKDEHIWSDELYRICDIEPGSKTTRQTFMDLVHPDDVDRIQAVIEDAIRGVDREIVYRIVTAEGVTKHLRTAGTVVDRIEGRYIITGAIQDITESKRVEEELTANQANLARALDHLVEAQRLSSTGSFTIDVDRDKHDWSDELYRIFELEIGSDITIQVVAAAIVPEDRHVYESAIRLGREGHNPDFEFRIALSDGRIKHLRAVAHRNMRVPDRFVFVGAIIDLTASKAAEEALNNARAELAQMSRSLSLGALTASIAHEVNQPLSGIITNASASLRMLGASPPNVAGAMITAERTIRDANRAAAVITRLRSLFKRKHQTSESVDLNEEAREALMLTAGELQRHRITVRTDFAEFLPCVLGDRLQLLQVILNLIRNATDAMGETEQGPREMLIATANEGSSATLSVRDSGVGIDPEKVEKLFDAFYTTKADGMGIGLSISRSIVESHRGWLLARANDGRGATFSFSIPVGQAR